jgi:hypothetical protein
VDESHRYGTELSSSVSVREFPDWLSSYLLTCEESLCFVELV